MYEWSLVDRLMISNERMSSMSLTMPASVVKASLPSAAEAKHQLHLDDLFRQERTTHRVHCRIRRAGLGVLVTRR